MKRFWMFLWLVFLVLHLLTLLVAHLRGDRRPETGALPAGAAGLVDLARLTNDDWLRLGFSPAGAPEQDPRLPPEEELLRCQALVLQLRQAEQELSRSGTEVRIADDLQGWITRQSDSGPAAQASSYLAGLLDWITPFRSAEGPCALERLLLHPDPVSRFPSLAFELSGQPSAMGGGLLAAGGRSPRWRLMEIDLSQPAPGSPWWTRGSLTFDAEAAP